MAAVCDHACMCDDVADQRAHACMCDDVADQRTIAHFNARVHQRP